MTRNIDYRADSIDASNEPDQDSPTRDDCERDGAAIPAIEPNSHFGNTPEMFSDCLAPAAQPAATSGTALLEAVEYWKAQWSEQAKRLDATLTELAASKAECAEAKKQQSHAWERCAEKDKAYGHMVADRDDHRAALVELGKTCERYRLVTLRQDADLAALREDRDRLIEAALSAVDHVGRANYGHRIAEAHAAINAARKEGK